MLEDIEIDALKVIAPFGQPPESKYDKLIARAKQVPKATTVVAYPCDETSLRGVLEAAEAGLITPILVGPGQKIGAVAKDHGINIEPYRIVDVPHSEASAARAVEFICRFASSEARAHDPADSAMGWGQLGYAYDLSNRSQRYRTESLAPVFGN